MNASIAAQRLSNQQLTNPAVGRPADVVAWLGAVQAQEYAPSQWGLGQRMADGTTAEDIERAFEQGEILRTHVMRPTWHYVVPADIRWLLGLTAARVHRIMAPYNRQLELDPATLVRGAAVVERALGDRRYLTRLELGGHLQRAGLDMHGVRLAHLAMYAELEAIICSGPRRGKQFTYALVAERAPDAVSLPRDEALAELSARYFRSHGPATIRDFAWWSGLTAAEAKRGLEMHDARRLEIGGLSYWTLGPATGRTRSPGTVHLLPIYDEYLIAYRDRDAVPHGTSVVASATRGPVTFQHALVITGEVVGTWKTTRTPRAGAIEVFPLRPLAERERRRLHQAAVRYGRFLNVPVTMSIA